MALSLLATKLYIPPARPNAVPRPLLIEKLTAGLSRPGSFALLSGPAGFGKTTLLSAFVAALRQPAAWVSLDEGDNDPNRFWTYLIAACRSVHPGVGESALALFRGGQPLPAETVPGILINDIAALDRRLVLVLDDFHAVQNESIHQGFTFLLERMPANLSVVVSTRIDPPWPLARLRARNQLVEVRAQDLRFSLEEAAEFLNRTMGLGLSAGDVSALEARTEGWIAGLQLAALSMQGRGDLPGFVKAFTGSHVYVAEYLVEEILQRRTEDEQSFLLRTSILDRLRGELCDAVTGRDDGQAALAALNRANLFVLPLDDEGRWFRYHHLFSDLLRSRLQQSLPAGEIAALHLRASEWHEQNGFAVEAINHALAAKDFDRVARLVGETANAILTRGELVTVMRWIEAMPADVIPRYPQIIILKIWALALVGAARQVEPLLQLAESQIESRGDTPAARELAGFAAAIRAFFAMMSGEDLRAIELAERAEALLPEQSVHARWLLPYTLGAAYRGQGRFDEALQAFERQARMGEEHDNLIVWGTGVTGMLLVLRGQGRLRETVELSRGALRQLEERGGMRFGSLAKLEVPLVEVLIQQNELEEARRRLAGVMDRLRGWPMPTDRLHALLAEVELREALGDLPGAFETLRAARDLRDSHPVLMNLSRLVDLCEVRLNLRGGDTAAAEQLLEKLQPGSSRWLELREMEQLLVARLRLAQGRPGEAAEILSPLSEAAQAGARKTAAVEGRALHALALAAQGSRAGALAALAQALALAEPEGFARAFAGEGEEMRSLLADVAHRLPEEPGSLPSKAYVERLLNAFEESSAAPAPPAPAQTGELVEQLTPRELEVLQRIAAGDSNRSIADRLVVTVSAVKKHTANIYGKLGVNSRTQAVARARRLGLLPDNE